MSMRSINELGDLYPFLDAMSPAGKHKVQEAISTQTIEAGADILGPGDRVGGIYLVRAGSIRVYYIDPNGGEGTLYWISPGESCILALNCLFTEMPYPAWAAADGEGVELVSLSGLVFRNLFASEKAVQDFLFEQLSSRVYSLLSRLERQMRLPLEGRLADLLLKQAGPDEIVRLSQEKLAHHLGTRREVVSRLLRRLVGQGLVQMAPRSITLLDRPGLAKVCDQQDLVWNSSIGPRQDTVL